MQQMVAGFLGLLSVFPTPLSAQDSMIAVGLADVHLMLDGAEVVISRRAAEDGAVPGCPRDCLQPMLAAPGVGTLGALEVIGVLRDEVAAGHGLLLDVRLPEEFAAAHLPGAVNVPGVTLASGNPALGAILLALGAKDEGEGLAFDAVPPLTIYGAGPNVDDAATAVQALIAAGIPAERLRYFRGGLQEWLQFGLTVSTPAQEG